jgi:hypothetical protein
MAQAISSNLHNALAVEGGQGSSLGGTGCAIRRPHLDLLKVSAYAGNAGFDLFVPREEERTVFQVEVKRVATLEGAAFFLSENERRQALALGPGWRLWLVASDGNSRDVSWIREELKRSQDGIQELLDQGLLPSDWLFRLE